MKSGQKLIVTLLAIIAILLGVVIFLQLNPVKKLPITNGVDAATAGEQAPTEEKDSAPPPPAENPIDDIVENVIAEEMPAGPAEVRVGAIPRQYWGIWTRRPELCGQQGADESAFQIGARKLQFWESTGEVKSVTLKNPMTVEVEADYTGEGQNWQAKSQFALSASKQDLMVGEPGKPGMWYKRCPGS